MWTYDVSHGSSQVNENSIALSSLFTGVGQRIVPFRVRKLESCVAYFTCHEPSRLATSCRPRDCASYI
eukprot:scaffold28606_cov118-Isochrysis_galbana.AAC.7